MFMPNAPVGAPVPGFSEKDLVKRSASSVPEPERRLTEVAKLIDISKCIGCKACQSACIEWNDTHPEMESFHGTYMNLEASVRSRGSEGTSGLAPRPH